MKTIFVVNGVVVGHGFASNGATVTHDDPESSAYLVDDSTAVDVGWTCTVTDGVPTFAAPTTPTYAVLTPMQFYFAFKTPERMLLKALATTGVPAGSALVNPAPSQAIPVDPIIAELWSSYQMAVDAKAGVDPNLPSIQEALAYLASPVAPTPAVIAADRIESILSGVAQ